MQCYFIWRTAFKLSHLEENTSKWKCQPPACLLLPSLFPPHLVLLHALSRPPQIWIQFSLKQEILRCLILKPAVLQGIPVVMFSLCLAHNHLAQCLSEYVCWILISHAENGIALRLTPWPSKFQLFVFLCITCLGLSVYFGYHGLSRSRQEVF